MDSAREELKPCPFCNGEASKDFHGYQRGPYRVFCESEGCGVNPFTTYRNKPEQAIAEWNTRAHLDRPAPELEWDGPQLMFNGREIGDYYQSERGWRYDFMGESNSTAFKTPEEAQAALMSDATAWLTPAPSAETQKDK